MSDKTACLQQLFRLFQEMFFDSAIIEAGFLGHLCVSTVSLIQQLAILPYNICGVHRSVVRINRQSVTAGGTSIQLVAFVILFDDDPSDALFEFADISRPVIITAVVGKQISRYYRGFSSSAEVKYLFFS